MFFDCQFSRAAWASINMSIGLLPPCSATNMFGSSLGRIINDLKNISYFWEPQPFVGQYGYVGMN
jgi:hypothetical protein